MKKKRESNRSYRQGARALAAADTHQRILAEFFARLQESWYEDITLDAVAQAAGVTVQTVIRRFLNKEGLLLAAAQGFGEEIRRRRRSPPGEVRGAIRALVMDYEITGDLTMRLLAQERLAAMQPVLALGRREHRAWVAQVFAPMLEPLSRLERERRVAALVVLTDVYTWKLLRRDQQLARNATIALITEMIEALIGPLATGPRATH